MGNYIGSCVEPLINSDQHSAYCAVHILPKCRVKYGYGINLALNQSQEKRKIILNQGQTIEVSSTVLELKNVPAELLLYANKQRKVCGDFITTGKAHTHNPFAKAISVWIILKNLTTSGVYNDLRLQKVSLAANCKMSVSVFERQLRYLKQHDLLSMKDGRLMVHNYSVLRRFGININQRIETIQYDTSNKIKLQDIFTTLAIQHEQNRCKQAYWSKVTSNQDVFNALSDVFKKGGAHGSLLADKEYFRQVHQEARMQTFENEKSGHEDFDLLHKLVKANPDINLKCETYAKYFGFIAPMAITHIKRKLQKLGLISVDKPLVKGEKRAHIDDEIFYVRYLPEERKTLWLPPDQLTVHLNHIIIKQQNPAAA